MKHANLTFIVFLLFCSAADAAEKCDFEKHRGSGCRDGYVCFDGTATIDSAEEKGPVKPLRPKNLIGFCLKECANAASCTKKQCAPKTIYMGDAIVFEGKVCLEK